MSNDWIVKTDREHVRQIAALRRLPRLEVADEDDAVWLRAPSGDEALDRLLRSLPGTRFHLLDDDQLVPWGKRVPTERLPRLQWQRLADWSAIVLPVTAMPAPVSSRVALRMVRGGRAQTPGALLADWQDWLTYATGAPEVRLRSLAFALSAPQESGAGTHLRAEQQGEDGLPSPSPKNRDGLGRPSSDFAHSRESRQRAFIVGSLLPPLAGHSYTLDDGIALPCGWTFSPAVGSAVIRKLLGLSEGEVALFAVDGTFERIAGEHFVRASRSAVRESARGEAYV